MRLSRRNLKKYWLDGFTIVSTTIAMFMMLRENYKMLIGEPKIKKKEDTRNECKIFSENNKKLNKKLLELETARILDSSCSGIPTIPTELNDVVSYDRHNNPIYRKECLLKGSLRKTDPFLIIGIPTITRSFKNQTAFYLEETLNAFIAPLTREEKESTQILVFLTDFNSKKREKSLTRLSEKYYNELNSGLINIVKIPTRYYRSLANLPQNFGDTAERVFWRSKQSLDYAFMFRYARKLSQYYMQTEDDALPRHDYLNVIRRDVKLGTIQSMMKDNAKLPWSHNASTWLAMLYHHSGYIGALFPTHKLEIAASMAETFYWNIPVDEGFKRLDVFSETFRIYQLETIFTHIGKQSSSKGN